MWHNECQQWPPPLPPKTKLYRDRYWWLEKGQDSLVGTISIYVSWQARMGGQFRAGDPFSSFPEIRATWHSGAPGTFAFVRPFLHKNNYKLYFITPLAIKMSVLLSHIKTFSLTWNSVFNSDLKDIKTCSWTTKSIVATRHCALPCPVDKVVFPQTTPLLFKNIQPWNSSSVRFLALLGWELSEDQRF